MISKGAPSLVIVILLLGGLPLATPLAATSASRSHIVPLGLPGIDANPVQGNQEYTLYPRQYIPFGADAHYQGVKLRFQISAPTQLDVYVMTPTEEESCCDAGYLYHWSAGNISEVVPLPAVGLYFLVVYNDLLGTSVRFLASVSTVPVDITLQHSASPAPVGIVDYGIETTLGGATAYQLEMSSVSATVLLNDAQAFNPSPPSGGSAHGAGIQLNVELRVNTTAGSYVYWLQNALLFYTNNDTANYNDNVWNQTMPGATLEASRVSGDGQILPVQSGQTIVNYYGAATAFFNYTYPLGIKFDTQVSYAGDVATVAFESARADNVSSQVQPSAFDTVKITEPGTISDAAIIVSGYETNPFGSYFDAELVFGGDCCGAVNSFEAMNSTLTMSYTLKSGGVMAPTSLFEYGSNTGEGTSDLAVSPSPSRAHGASYQVRVGETNFTADLIRPTANQFPLIVSYSMSGGNFPGAAPSIDYVANGTEVTRGLSVVPQTIEADVGSAYSFLGLANSSTTTERWISNATGGMVSRAETVTVAVHHQYYVTVGSTDVGGTVSPMAGWYDAGTTLRLLASPRQGWILALWNGTGAGAYNGNNDSADFAISGPVTEQATFYPGLTVVSSGSGTVGYSYADELGGGQGTLVSGSNGTFFVPIGTMVTLTASSAGMFVSFENWSGNLSGTQATELVTVDSPTSVTANFGYNLTDVVVALVAVGAALALAGFVYYKRRAGAGRVRG